MKTTTLIIPNGAIHHTITEGTLVLEHDMLLVHGNRTYDMFVTEASFDLKIAEAKRRGDDHRVETQTRIKEQHMEMCRSNDPQYAHHELFSISQRSSILCVGQHPDHGKDFYEVEFGMLVEYDGKQYTIESDYNNNLKLVEVV